MVSAPTTPHKGETAPSREHLLRQLACSAPPAKAAPGTPFNLRQQKQQQLTPTRQNRSKDIGADTSLDGFSADYSFHSSSLGTPSRRPKPTKFGVVGIVQRTFDSYGYIEVPELDTNAFFVPSYVDWDSVYGMLGEVEKFKKYPSLRVFEAGMSVSFDCSPQPQRSGCSWMAINVQLIGIDTSGYKPPQFPPTSSSKSSRSRPPPQQRTPPTASHHQLQQHSRTPVVVIGAAATMQQPSPPVNPLEMVTLQLPAITPRNPNVFPEIELPNYTTMIPQVNPLLFAPTNNQAEQYEIFRGNSLLLGERLIGLGSKYPKRRVCPE